MIYLIFGYIYLALHRPMEIWTALDPYRIELVYFSFLCAAWLFARKRLTIDLPQVAIAGIGLAVYAAWLLSPWSEYGDIQVKNFTFVVVFALILATTLRDERALHRVIVIFLSVMTIYMLHSVREYLNGRHTYRMGISRLIGVDVSLADPNTFGASIVYALPFVRYLWLKWEPGWKRKALVGYVLLSIGCIALTGSRSALVGLAVWAAATIWLTGRRKLPLVAFGLIFAAVGFTLLPDELQNRFTTIIDPSVGPENARVSGQGRIDGFFVGIDLWSRFPVTGVGPGAWRPASGRSIESHNLYGQMLGELGTLGVAAFALMIIALSLGLVRLLRLIQENDPEPKAEPLYHLAQAIGLSTLLLLFEGLFGHNLYRYNYVWYCAFVTVALRSYRSSLRAGRRSRFGGVGTVVGLSDFVFGRLVWPLWAKRDHPRLIEFANEIASRQFDSAPIRATRQSHMLRRIVRHAATTVPYYRQLFAELRLSPDDIRSSDDLKRLPILTKQQIRKLDSQLVSDQFRNQPTVLKSTSGSTGVPLRILLDYDGLAWKRATTLVADEWSGWRRGRRVAKVWGNPEHRKHGIKGWLRNKLFDRAIHLDTLQMSEAEIEDFAQWLANFRPRLIFGHAHSVALLASMIRDRGWPRCRPDGVITTAMVLHDYQRRAIEDVFNCRVTNRYGCEEVSLIACECPAHRGLHVNDESVFVELVNGELPAAQGQAGQVVITDLTNYAMPLLRYQVGDVATWANEPCSCGRGSAVLASIAGREADYVVTAAGDYVSGISLTENFATLVPGIAQLQIVQEAVDQFLFRIVRARQFTALDETQIAALVLERFGPTARLRCEFVDNIPSEPSGKYRFCISHVTGAGRAA